jgi:hypothetical protein
VRRRAAFAAVLATAAFCAAAGAAQAPQATLKLEHRIDGSRGFYVEGAYYYASLRRGSVSIVRRFSGARMTMRVTAGRYVLRSYARPCDGNCGLLDPASDGCSANVRLRAGTTTRIRIVAPPGSPCRLRIVR